MPRAATPPRRDQSVISRVVEQVRETPGSFGRPVAKVTPPRREDEMDIGGGGEMESGPNDEF
jgi:hypothetical protein